jgi:hypothetical protein
MARRRRRRGGQLGGTPIQHVRSLRKALQHQNTSATNTIMLARAGKCQQAIAAWEDTIYWRGLAVAHADGTGRKSLPRGTLGPLRKMNEARRVFENACIVKGH